MDATSPQSDPVLTGSRKDEAQRAADASQSLLFGLECRVTRPGPAAVVDGIVGADLFGAGGDEHDSLFGGDDGMESLFGDEARDEQPQQQQNQQPLALPLSCLLALPFPPLSSGISESTCDVSTFFPELTNEQQQQQQQQQQHNQEQQHELPEQLQHQHQHGEAQPGLESGLLLPDLSFDAMIGLDLNLDFEMDFGLAVELAMAQEAQNTPFMQEFQGLPEMDTSDLLHHPLSPADIFTTPSTTTALAPAATTAPTPDAAAGYDGHQLSFLQMQASPALGIDTLFHPTGLGTPDDQEGHGRSALANSSNKSNYIDISNDSDDDVVILSSKQVSPGFVYRAPAHPDQQPAAPATSTPHYLELRPRCPQGPPPLRIDLSPNVEELLPHVQLHSKLSIRRIQDLLGLDADAGRYLVATCQRHLADPAYTVRPSGSSDPAALRVLKVTLIHSSLALLVQGTVGQRWFAPDAPLEPKSPHVWPDDSTTLTLLFIQLLYRLTRNNNARERHRKRGAATAAATAAATETTTETSITSAAISPASTSAVGIEASPATTAESPTSPIVFELPTPATSPKPREAKQSQPRKRKRKPKATAPAAAVPQLPLPSLISARPLFSYSSPRVVRDTLLCSCAGNGNKGITPCTEPGPIAVKMSASPPPANAILRYRVNIVDNASQERTIPQVVLAHEGPVRDAGFSHIVDMCARLGKAIDSVSIVTIKGLECVSDDIAWDRVVGQTYNQVLMDAEIRVLVCIQ
ncbi:hypothetical protein SBRCBS47491_006769 [Sporothrix bragantina]|uniref:Uncharacterized protein n=1 Tax=Sporothrix bragantina TaxID=671064 RepID=A0ABP0C7N2_9PEZI